ncbi:hypothetical protein [Roseibium sediminicola]|uniref:PPM-type phosphatase domain-containing protein n=1 Tax=Roseibium sediminicola TaxID=2933272 RepID=A0ABT0H2E0_9HYPH|nr:hypothetical protein [Roseibium sp. CAU 1639]MCK7615462.1 hypothetical protein [Roseibium sp. CAU 1639]
MLQTEAAAFVSAGRRKAKCGCAELHAGLATALAALVAYGRPGFDGSQMIVLVREMPTR